MAPSRTTSALFVLAPTSGVRFGNSFAKGLDETLVSPKGQISQKIPDPLTIEVLALRDDVVFVVDMNYSQAVKWIAAKLFVSERKGKRIVVISSILDDVHEPGFTFESFSIRACLAPNIWEL
jgi:hypothetical protein